MSSGPRRAYDLLRGYVNREWDRIRGVEEAQARDELNEPANHDRTEITTRKATPEEERTYACKVLGVEAGASFDEIRKAYLRLRKRSDPGNFPANTEEQRHAKDIFQKVQWAYDKLTADVPVAEKRFRSLELD